MSFYEHELKELKLKPSDIEKLSDNEQMQKIRLQWMFLCFHAKNQADPSNYTRYYHKIIDNIIDVDSNNIPSKLDTAITNYLNHHCNEIYVSSIDFDPSQRDEIVKKYHMLLEAFSRLQSDEISNQFIETYTPFLALAFFLKQHSKEFDASYGNCLYQKRNETWSTRYIFQWHLMMIRLFAIEGLDDFQYSDALATGKLRSILATEKICNPIKILVALINSIILIMTTILHGILGMHDLFVIVFFCLQSHPLGILMAQLPLIARILEMLACPINQIIRPLCLYTQWSAPSVTLLLGVAGFSLLYGVLYTSMLTYVAVLSPYISLGMVAYFLYLVVKQAIALFEESPSIAINFIIQIGVLLGLKVCTMQLLNIQPSEININYRKQILSICTAVSIITLLNSNWQTAHDVLEFFSLNGKPLSEDIYDIVKIGYKKANLSQRFFNTPENEPPIYRGDIPENTPQKKTLVIF